MGNTSSAFEPDVKIVVHYPRTMPTMVTSESFFVRPCERLCHNAFVYRVSAERVFTVCVAVPNAAHTRIEWHGAPYPANMRDDAFGLEQALFANESRVCSGRFHFSSDDMTQRELVVMRDSDELYRLVFRVR